MMQPNAIPVIYKNMSFNVNLNSLCHVSKRFNDLMKSYFDDNGNELPQLEILCENFTERNVSNFFKIVQNLQTDVQNSEIKEICEIALMFQANDIYNKALSFVRETIDPNFSIPEDKYANCISKFIQLTTVGKLIHHLSNFSDLEFEMDSEDKKNNLLDNDIDYKQSSANSYKNQSLNEMPAIYLIKSEFLSRGQRLTFIQNNKIIMSAKVKGKKIYLSNKTDGSFDTNISSFVPRIERSSNLTNKAFLQGQEIYMKYILGKNDHFSMEVSFDLDGKNNNWLPKEIDMKVKSGEYKNLISGLYNRSFRRSPINTALKSKNNKTEFILRKVGHNSFETECSPTIPQNIVFSIAISQIVGPFFDAADVLSCGKESVIPTVPFSIA